MERSEVEDIEEPLIRGMRQMTEEVSVGLVTGVLFEIIKVLIRPDRRLLQTGMASNLWHHR